MTTRRRLGPRVLFGLTVLITAPLLRAQSPQPFDAAAAFGARVDITSLRLSPDGQSVAFITPIQGQGSALYTVGLAPGSKPKVAFYVDGKPMRLMGCSWVANDRLVCDTYGLFPDTIGGYHGILPVSRLYAVNADGTTPKQLNVEANQTSRYGVALSDSSVIDWLPDQDGSILMARYYLPSNKVEFHIGSEANGLGVDVVNTRTLAINHVIPPRPDSVEYLTDGRGTVRVVEETIRLPNDQLRPDRQYLYTIPGSNEWHELSSYNENDKTGFRPVAVDHDLNIVYGWQKLDGRFALYSYSLDGSLSLKLVYSRADVDLGGLIRIGRRNRVVGVTYNTEYAHTEYFDEDFKQLMKMVHNALPQLPLINVIDSSVDESKVLLFAGSDTDSGAYYILDRKSHSLIKFLATRAKLVGVTLARVKPISYPASDGQMIPGYLTLPPGVEDPRGLPAIVMPHGGPDARDQWGFDWLAQFYAARGYVVLQPNFRGSSGYGDAWFQSNGFKSWQIAIGDVVAAGHWLVNQGIADPAKIGIVGWSYGGYAALQSAVVDPGLFKAVIAVAPVTDFAALKDEHGFWNNYYLVSDEVGSGPLMRDGSPINHADKIKAPVLLFHGTADRNVSVEESKRMASALKAAGAQCDLVIFQDRDHQLEDSAVRTDMLRQSDAFLRRAFGMGP